MDYRQLGGSGFRVPVLSLGIATFGGEGECFRFPRAGPAPLSLDGDHWRPQRGAVAAESRRGRLGAVGGSHRASRCRQRLSRRSIHTGINGPSSSGTRRRS